MNKQLYFLLTILAGISAGVPLAAAGGTLQAWMKNENIDIGTIGLFALVGTPYSLKLLWAPFLDRYSLPVLSRRRGWIILSQIFIGLGFLLLSNLNPKDNLGAISLVALFISFFGATQDIVVDAYRREQTPDQLLALTSSLFTGGYRVGLLIAGALALSLSLTISWHGVYTGLALLLFSLTLATYFLPEHSSREFHPRTLREAFVEPLMEFLRRRYIFPVIVFILIYKIGDVFAAALNSIFILDLGFSNADLGLYVKTFGLTASIVGGVLGGYILSRISVYRGLFIFGIIQALGILPFVLLAHTGQSHPTLAFAITVENLTSGMGTSAYATYLALLCNRKYTATQFALLTSLMALPRTLFASQAGFIAEAVGWVNYFSLCVAICIPGMVMLLVIKKKGAFEAA